MFNFLGLNLKVQPQETEHKIATPVSAKHNTKNAIHSFLQ